MTDPTRPSTAVRRVPTIDRRDCRREAETRFTADRMVADYERLFDASSPAGASADLPQDDGGRRRAVDVYLITDDGVRDCAVDELPELLTGRHGIVWVDIPQWSAEAADVLTTMFGLHPLAVHDCEVRNRLPKLHAYPGSLFLVLHAPERGAGGHVHHVELDRLIGPRYLVTVHGPVNPAVPIEVALRDTHEVLERIRAGRLRPRTSFDISHAIVSTLTRRMEKFVEDLTSDVWELEATRHRRRLWQP